MKKIFSGVILSLLSIVLSAQMHELVYWTGSSCSGEDYPLPAAEMSDMLYDAMQDNMGFDSPEDSSLSPFLSFRLGLIDVLSFERFVIHGETSCSEPGLDLQLRWSGDNFASSLGDFIQGIGGQKFVDMPGEGLTGTGTVEFRICFVGGEKESSMPVGQSESKSFSIFGEKSCHTASRIDVAECEHYTSPSGKYTWTRTGIYKDTIPNSAGCDSLLSIDLIVMDAATGRDSQTAKGSYTWIDGITYTESNQSAVFNIAGGAFNGCDSLVRLDLEILPY